MFKPILALSRLAAANDIESVVVIRLPHLDDKQEKVLLQVLNELMITYSVMGPCLCLYGAGKRMDTLRMQLQGHGLSLPTSVHEGCHQLILQPTVELAKTGLVPTGVWVSLKNPGHVSVWSAQVDYRQAYGPSEVHVLQELLTDRFLASDFCDRFVTAPGKDRGVAVKVLTFTVPKDRISDFPHPIDTPAGRIILDFAQPEARVAIRTGPPRPIGESSYLHWINTHNGRRAADSAVFGIEAPVRTPAHYRKMSVQQVTLSADAAHSARLGTVMADPNLILLMHGSVATSLAPSFVEWVGLRSALGLAPRTPEYEWKFVPACWTADWGCYSNPLAHLVTIPPRTELMLRSECPDTPRRNGGIKDTIDSGGHSERSIVISVGSRLGLGYPHPHLTRRR